MAHKLGASVLAVMAVTVLAAPAAARHAEKISHRVSDRHCARDEEQSAIEVAEVQQELMVAALTCHNVQEFNAFQVGYLKDLRISDRRLMDMFRRVDGRRGEAEYHAFKTRLANDSSIRSIHDNPAFCAEAKQIFAQAAVPNPPRLNEFVASVPLHDAAPIESCAQMQAAEEPVPNVVPTPNPRLAALEMSSETVPQPAAAAAAPASPQQPAATAPVAAASPADASKPAEAKKKSGGLFSHIFN